MHRLSPRGKPLLATAALSALLVASAATAAYAGVWLPGQQPSEPVAAPVALDHMHRPSLRTLPVQRLPAPPTPRPAVVAPAPSGRCGGSLPTCAVMACESGGDIRVRNHRGSSASGKWQIIKSTWDGYGGYAEARDAPEHVQDAKARELWAGGAGRGHWRSCL